MSYFNVMGNEWEALSTEAYGYTDAADAAELKRAFDIEDREQRRAMLRTLRTTKKARYAHIREVYMVMLRKKGQDALLVDRQYTAIGTLPDGEARALINRSVVTNITADYSLTQYPEQGAGTCLWLAFPNSPEADHSDARTGSEALAQLGA